MHRWSSTLHYYEPMMEQKTLKVGSCSQAQPFTKAISKEVEWYKIN